MPNDKETFPTPGSTDDAKSAVSNEKTSKLVPALDPPTIFNQAVEGIKDGAIMKKKHDLYCLENLIAK
ncbi:3209_t:CDS:2 [Entrophospora sp. SA101]|nr:3209_t:CDS:2 [Entrophospora sp. SA101]